MPARGTLPTRSGGLGRILRPVLAVLVLLLVAAASWRDLVHHATHAAAAQWRQRVARRRPESGPGWRTPGAPGAPGQTPQPTTFVAPPTTPVAVPAPIFVPIEAFTVTLQNADTERIMHVGLTLRVNDEQTRTRLEKYMPEVRSRILMVLSSQSPTAVQTSQGKTDMANAIKQAVNRPFSPLPDGQYVTDVLFTAFVVQ